jgi:hypothetical protein
VWYFDFCLSCTVILRYSAVLCLLVVYSLEEAGGILAQFLETFAFLLPSGALWVPCFMVLSASTALSNSLRAQSSGVVSTASATNSFVSTLCCVVSKPSTIVALDNSELWCILFCRVQTVANVDSSTNDLICGFDTVSEDDKGAAFG